MKKITGFLLILSFLFMISACGNAQENSEKTNDTKKHIRQEVWENKGSFIDFAYDELERKLLLLELPSNDILAQILLKDTEIVDSYSEISDAYAVVKSTYDEKAANVTSMNEIVISTGTSKEKSLYEYILYDNALQEKEVIDLKSMISEELLRDIEESQSETCIEPSGKKVAWSTGSGMYVLDMESGQVMTYELKSDGFGEYEIIFIDENKLGFYQMRGEVNIDTRYGYWDLATNELFYEEETDYTPSQMRVSGTYLVLNDWEDLETECSSGKVLLYDCEKQEGKVISVDNTESTFACITSDGKNLITYQCMNDELTEHRVRIYRLSDEEGVSEENFTSESGVRFYDFCNTQKDYQLIGIGDSGKVVYHAFTTE